MGPVSIADAITQIRSSTTIYFTRVDGDDAFVRVIDGPYLRTDPDTTATNNLDVTLMDWCNTAGVATAFSDPGSP
jgi:hypothetical protein